MSRILLIEDNRDHLELMAYILRSHGHTILSAGSAESGWSMMNCCENIDLIICDINLGRSSGLDLIRRIRSSLPCDEIPVLAVTAGSIGQAHEAFKAGFDRYLLKPIDPATFIAEVHDCLSFNAGVPAKAKPRPLTATAESKERARILTVDDRKANLELLSALLQPLGYEMVCAAGVSEALIKARNAPPDLIITDVHMGDGSGFDLVRTIQEDRALCQIPWLVTSATYLVMDARAEQIHLDASNFILQPWDPQQLIDKIHQRLRQKVSTTPKGSDAGLSRSEPVLKGRNYGTNSGHRRQSQ